MGLDHCFTHEFSGSHALHLFEEMSHSCGLCNGDSFVLVLQFGYHKGIHDKGGGLPKDKIWKDHSRIFRYKIGTILISCCTNESENATAYNKDGTVCLSEFNSMDFLAICELGFVLNAKKRNFLEEADPFIVPAEKTCLALNVFDEIPDSSCRVVVNYDMYYCKGIRDKGGGSKFRYMVTLNIHFSCMNVSGDFIECCQDGIFGVVLLVAYSTYIVIGGEFYSSNIQFQACVANREGLVGGSFQLDHPSVGVTETLMMVAHMTDGTTVMSNVARKPEVADLARFLTDYGACIEGASNNKLINKGTSQLHGFECVIAPDRIEVDTFILAAAITHSCISILPVMPCQVSYLIHNLSAVGCKIKQSSHNTLAILALLGRGGDNLQSFEVTGPYPGFLTYLQPKLMALLTTCNGLSSAEESVFDKSIGHVSTTLISSSTNDSENAITFNIDVANGTIWLILISIGKTTEIVRNTVLCKTWGLPIVRVDSCQPIWPLVLTHKLPNNTTSMVVNFVFSGVIGALFAEKERKQTHRVGVHVDFLYRCSVYVSSVIMHLYSRCGNEHNALRFFLDPDLCEITKPNISWNSLLVGYFESRASFGSLNYTNYFNRIG